MVWLALITLLWRANRSGRSEVCSREVLRLLPDVVRLLGRLAADRSLPRGVRVGLGLGLAYLLVPVDVVPDFVPVVGYADDAIVVALALRCVIRRAGRQALTRHWPGTTAGLHTLEQLVGISVLVGDRDR